MINSRNKGNTFEREIAIEYRGLWFKDCLTARDWSWKKVDDSWIDIIWIPMFNIQCKSYTNLSVGKVLEVLGTMPSKNWNINILHAKITRKWQCVTMSKKDFYEIIQLLIKENLIKIN